MLEQLSDLFGTDSDRALAITLACVVFLGFLAKALLTSSSAGGSSAR